MAAVLALGVATTVRAVPGPGCEEGGADAAQATAKVAAARNFENLKADLILTPQQEPLWQAFAAQVDKERRLRLRAICELGGNESLTAPERMERMTAMMRERLAAKESLQDSLNRLYDVLAPDQRAVADKGLSDMWHRRRSPGESPRGPSDSGPARP